MTKIASLRELGKYFECTIWVEANYARIGWDKVIHDLNHILITDIIHLGTGEILANQGWVALTKTWREVLPILHKGQKLIFKTKIKSYYKIANNYSVITNYILGRVRDITLKQA